MDVVQVLRDAIEAWKRDKKMVGNKRATLVGAGHLAVSASMSLDMLVERFEEELVAAAEGEASLLLATYEALEQARRIVRVVHASLQTLEGGIPAPWSGPSELKVGVSNETD